MEEMIHLATPIFLILLCYLRSFNCDVYDGKFFDQNNLTYAECVNENSYLYYGTKDTNQDGEKCESWKNVTAYHMQLFEGYNQYFFADEYLDHSYCRNIPLDIYQRNQKFNNATAHHYVQTDGWKHGPWCYIKVAEGSEILLWGRIKSHFTPQPCFKQCTGAPESATAPPPLPKKSASHTKYNWNLIEHIAQNIFSGFDHGDEKYYNTKPSDKTVSAAFKSNATIIFYVGSALLILIIGFIFAKHFYSIWKKRPKVAAENVAKEIEQEEPVENNEQKEIQKVPETVAELPKIIPEEKPVTPTPHKRKLRKI